jgi:hypothetical protein
MSRKLFPVAVTKSSPDTQQVVHLVNPATNVCAVCVGWIASAWALGTLTPWITTP